MSAALAINSRSTAVCPECSKRVGIFDRGDGLVIFEAHTDVPHGRLLDGDACAGSAYMVEVEDL